MTQYQVAVFGSGCFWCSEAVFERLKGVISVMPGYAGGHTPNPTYQAVCSGDTGHAEVVRIEFDPAQISYSDLLEVFFGTHDPTTPNRQDHDVGTQYRSIILYADQAQRKEAEAFINELNESRVFDRQIVTEVKPLGEFYDAEPYHREYYRNNPHQPYCQFVIHPKMEKAITRFRTLLRSA